MVFAQSSNAAPDSQGVIRAESRLVLVDAVVTDKKGNYVHDLTAKDFRVWEDNKEQSIKTFSFQADPASPSSSQKRYLVLFFDNSTIAFADQARARQAAAQFIDASAGPDRMIAIANFGGSLSITQNFTGDTDRLKKLVAGLKFSNVSPNGDAGGGGVSLAVADYGARDLILALRSLAKSLGTIPGRKTLVLLTGGFPLAGEYISEVTAAIDACNKANVAVYPIDIRGLVAPATGLNFRAVPRTQPAGAGAGILPAVFSSASTIRAVFPLLQLAYFEPQHTGGGGGGGGGAGGGGGHVGGGGGTGGGGSRGGGSGGGSGGGRGGGGAGGGKGGGGSGGGRGGGGSGGGRGGTVGGQPMLNSPLSPYNQARNILPSLADSITGNQQVMYMLADGTGGFVIANTNDLLSGLQKIGKEQNEYYLLGYTPTESQEGSCHTLKVKAEHGMSVRARTGYCNVRAPDLLAGNSTEQALEKQVNAAPAGAGGAAIEAPFFYTAPNTARVAIAMEIPAGKIDFEKQKGKQRSELNILGVAYTAAGTVAARFSDTVKLTFDNKKELEEFQDHPFHYENEFEIPPGKYTLKVAFSSGEESFGKAEIPLAIDAFDGKQFSISGLALSKDVRPISEMDLSRDAALLQDRTPMVTQGLQITPTGIHHFAKTDLAAIYVELYEPMLKEATPPAVGLQLKVVDAKTGQAKEDTGLMNMQKFVQAGNPVIPVALRLPLANLAPGAYRAELKAQDSAGHISAVRITEFNVE